MCMPNKFILICFPLIYQICSLLFGAVANDQDSIKSELPSLVYASDTEDDARDSGNKEEE